MSNLPSRNKKALTPKPKSRLVTLLELLLEKNGISVSELSIRTSIPEKKINAWLSGKSTPSLEEIEAALAAVQYALVPAPVEEVETEEYPIYDYMGSFEARAAAAAPTDASGIDLLLRLQYAELAKVKRAEATTSISSEEAQIRKAKILAEIRELMKLKVLMGTDEEDLGDIELIFDSERGKDL